MRSLNAQLSETSSERGRAEERLNVLQKSLGDVEEDKRGLGLYLIVQTSAVYNSQSHQYIHITYCWLSDGRFASAQTALMLQEETIRRNERERKVMTEKLATLERNLSAAESEKRQLQERSSKLKAVSFLPYHCTIISQQRLLREYC